MGTQAVSVPRLGANVPIFGAIGNGVTEVSQRLQSSRAFDLLRIQCRCFQNHGASHRQRRRNVLSSPASRGCRDRRGQCQPGWNFRQWNYERGYRVRPRELSARHRRPFYTYNLTHNLDLTVPWWAWYAQDQWQVNRKLVLTLGSGGTISPPPTTITEHSSSMSKRAKCGGSVPPPSPSPPRSCPWATPRSTRGTPRDTSLPKRTAGSRALGPPTSSRRNTVGHVAFGIFDQHDNQLTQGNENLALNWPNGDDQTLIQPRHRSAKDVPQHSPDRGIAVEPDESLVGR